MFSFIFSQWTEDDEITDYKKNQEWMDECMDGMFEKWYDKIDEEDSMEDRRKVSERCWLSLANSWVQLSKQMAPSVIWHPSCISAV